MPKQIAITSRNYDSNRKMFIYKLPQQQNFTNTMIGLSSLSIYNSFFNISKEYGNNTVAFTFYANFTKDPYTGSVINTTSYTFNWTIPDGFYSTSDINYWLLNQMTYYNLYCTINGANVYFLEVIVNRIIYGNQINFSLIQNNGYTLPANCGWSFYTTGFLTPKLIFASGFGLRYGFTGGTYGNQSTNRSYQSDVVSQVNVINALIFTCNLIDNYGLSSPTNVFISVGVNAGFGSLISLNVTPVYNNISPNSYSQIEIGLLDQNFNIINLYDTECTIMLSLEQSK